MERQSNEDEESPGIALKALRASDDTLQGIPTHWLPFQRARNVLVQGGGVR